MDGYRCTSGIPEFSQLGQFCEIPQMPIAVFLQRVQVARAGRPPKLGRRIWLLKEWLEKDVLLPAHISVPVLIHPLRLVHSPGGTTDRFVQYFWRW